MSERKLSLNPSTFKNIMALPTTTGTRSAKIHDSAECPIPGVVREIARSEWLRKDVNRQTRRNQERFGPDR